MGGAKKEAIPSGFWMASRLGTSSPRMMEKYVITSTTTTSPMVSA